MAPCLVFIDGIDVVAKRRENAQKDMEVFYHFELFQKITALFYGKT